MPNDIVAGDEILFRRVSNAAEFYHYESGRLRLKSTAFNDPGRKPSVDRSKLREHPSETKSAPTDGIVSVLTRDVRAIASIRNVDVQPSEPSVYGIDVIARPVLAGNDRGLPENLAHAQVESAPELATDSRFKKLKEALALLAEKGGWIIEPT